MKEDFLHYLWKYQKFAKTDLKTTDGELLQVFKVGNHNTQSDGPDFSIAQLVINVQKWAGNVEVHIKSSDWFAHNHQTDANYDSVILHVVWEDDVDVYRQNDTKIPTLELKSVVSAEALNAYQQLYANSKERWINCETHIKHVDKFVVENWLERLYFERLEQKCEPITNLLNENKNNWEATCFCLLAKSFGGNTNGEAFFKMAQSIPFSIVQKETSVFKLEALFMGQANLLNEKTDDPFEKTLLNEYYYLKKKFSLTSLTGVKAQFYRLRPPNFPTIRLSQLAVLYASYNDLFVRLNQANSLNDLKTIFNLKASEYWDTHYNFGKETKSIAKKISSSYLSVICLNSVIPLRFLFGKHTHDSSDFTEELLELVRSLKPEKNTIVSNYGKAGVNAYSALDSQALLTLYKNYCNVGKCTHCNVGVSLLGSQ